MSGKAFEPTQDELTVYLHWQAKSSTATRSPAVREGHLKRIRARLRDGFTVDQLMLAVDVAAWDEFYVEHGYHKQPDVIFRNASRIDRLLSLEERERNRPIPL